MRVKERKPDLKGNGTDLSKKGKKMKQGSNCWQFMSDEELSGNIVFAKLVLKNTTASTM